MPRDTSFIALRRKLSRVAGAGKLESLAKERTAVSVALRDGRV
jgi:hypothetical protein